MLKNQKNGCPFVCQVCVRTVCVCLIWKYVKNNFSIVAAVHIVFSFSAFRTKNIYIFAYMYKERLQLVDIKFA